MPKPSTSGPFRELPAISTSDWDNLAAVRRALRELEQGSFGQAAELVDAIGRDDRIEGVVSARLDTLAGLEFELEPEEDLEEDARAKDIAKAAKKDWLRWVPESELRDLRFWGLWLGAAPAQLVWTKGERWSPRLQVMHPRYLRWDTNNERYQMTTADGTHEVTPGDGTWVLYTPYGDRRGWMRSFVRSLAQPWLIRQWATRDWARHSEAHGIPAKKAKTPVGATKEEKKRFLREVAALASDPTILLEQGRTKDNPGYDVELLEAAVSSYEVFEKLKGMVETDIAIRVKGENLTTEVKGGSYAAAQAHRGVSADKVRFDGKSIATCLRDHLTAPWARFNFGDDQLAPRPCWDTEPPEDLGSKATTVKTVADALVAMQTAGAPVDRLALLEEFEIPVDESLPANPPPPAPAKGGAQLSAARRVPPGVLAGQAYCDDLVDEGAAAGSRALAPDLRELLSIVADSPDYETIRKRLREAYRAMSPAALAGAVEKCLVLSELNGQLAAGEDAEGTR